MANVDIPIVQSIVQLSIDEMLPAATHYEIGRRLAPLPTMVLIVGSVRLG